METTYRGFKIQTFQTGTDFAFKVYYPEGGIVEFTDLDRQLGILLRHDTVFSYESVALYAAQKIVDWFYPGWRTERLLGETHLSLH